MKAAPTQPSPTYATKRFRGGPANSTRTSIANDPKAARIDVCGCLITLSASAKTAGITIAARAALFSAAKSATAADDTSALCQLGLNSRKDTFGCGGEQIDEETFVPSRLGAAPARDSPSPRALRSRCTAHRPICAWRDVERRCQPDLHRRRQCRCELYERLRRALQP